MPVSRVSWLLRDRQAVDSHDFGKLPTASVVPLPCSGSAGRERASELFAAGLSLSSGP